jgi:AraC-like DNA-binding protein
VLPDGRFHLVLNLETGIGAIAGLRSSHVVVDTGRMTAVMGVVFRAGAARAFVAAPAVDFRDRAIGLADIWGPGPASQLLDRLRESKTAEARMNIVEAALIDRMKKRGTGAEHLAIHPIMRYALESFGHAPHMRSIADVSREIGWSRRWFSQAFAEQVGMTRYCEASIGPTLHWGGFCDQAHRVHEFRAFSGLSPERFLACEGPYPNHVRVT